VKPVPVKTAREIGQAMGFDRVVIIAIRDDEARGSLTSWGRTKAKCDALGRWIDSIEAVEAAVQVRDAE